MLGGTNVKNLVLGGNLDTEQIISYHITIVMKSCGLRDMFQDCGYW